MGRPAHQPTDETRALVRQYVADGMIQEHIAAALGISADTLQRHYRADLDVANDEWERRFEESIKARVLRDDCPPALVIFTAKCRLGWRELTPKDPDKVILDDLSDDQLAALVAQRARRTREQRSGGDPTQETRAA